MLTKTNLNILKYFIRSRENGSFSELGLKIKLLRVLASTKYTKEWKKNCWEREWCFQKSLEDYQNEENISIRRASPLAVF